MKLNILFINSVQIYGGGEVWMVTALSELQRRGHRVTLVCRKDAEMIPHAREQGIEVVPMRIRGDFDPVTIFQMAKLMRKRNIDIVLTNMDKELRISGIASRFGGKPIVFSRRGIDTPLKNKLHYRFTYNSLADVIVANSESTKNTLVSNAPWLDADRIHVIYNGIEPDWFQNHRTKDLRKSLGIPANAVIIGFVGRLNVQKGIVYLLDAFKQVAAKHENAHLLIAGQGDLEATIRAFADQKGLAGRIHILGFRKDTPDIMRTINMLALPSLWEGFGIVLIEAMAAGKPCITTQISSMPEIVIHEKTGFVVPPKDATQLAEAISKLIQNPGMEKKMGESGKKVVDEKFTLNRMIESYESLFFEVTIKFRKGKQLR